MSEFMLEVVKFLVQGVILGVAGFGITFLYSKKQQQLAEDEFNHKLLMRFNDWYDELNDDLHSIRALESREENIDIDSLRKNEPALYKKLNDYLKL